MTTPMLSISNRDGRVLALVAAVSRKKFRDRAKVLSPIREVMGVANGASNRELEALFGDGEAWKALVRSSGYSDAAIEALEVVLEVRRATNESEFQLARKRLGAFQEELTKARKAAKARRKLVEAERRVAAKFVEAERRAAAEAARMQASRDFFEKLFSTHAVSSDRFPIELFVTLNGEATRIRYEEVFGEKPNITNLKKRFQLTAEAYKALSADKRAWEAEQKAKKEADRAVRVALREQERAAQSRRSEMIHAAGVPDYLGIKKSEFEAWRADGRIPVSARKAFYKWGRTLEATLHHPDDLAHITPELIAEWLAQDAAARSGRAKASREAASKQRMFILQVRSALLSLGESAKIIVVESRMSGSKVRPFDRHGRPVASDKLHAHLKEQGALLLGRYYPVAVDAFEDGEPLNVHLQLTVAARRPETREELAEFQEHAPRQFPSEVPPGILSELTERLTCFVKELRLQVPKGEHPELRQRLQAVLLKGIPASRLDTNGGLAISLREDLTAYLEDLEAERARVLLKLEDYPQAFPVARSLNRTLYFRVGPTNSGKTHVALERLAAAESGVYLAPLRLLAIEIRDRLMEVGVPCNLLTGEERIIVPGARHTASTVEMLNPQAEVEVAVIDEIQMIADESRGWAWTAALIGAPARELYVCGSNTALKLCKRVAEHLGETYNVTVTERYAPLEVESHPADLRHLQKGDAIIAFSRKDVLTLSAEVRQAGFSVASIYGALSPEVRRTEARRFAEGAADIVVATDAIGMGLNLPIRRVVFSTRVKFDGTSKRALNAMEVHQIAGRAGRFGMHDKGLVTAMSELDLKHVARMLAAPPPKENLSRLPIAASAWHIEQLGELLGAESLYDVVSYFAEKVSIQSPLFFADSMNDSIELSDTIDDQLGQCPLRERYALSLAPVSEDQQRYFAGCLDVIAENTTLKLPEAPKWLNGEDETKLQDAELLSKNLGLYAWLSFKYPKNFPDMSGLPKLRHAVSRFIERTLLKQKGFSYTPRRSYGYDYFGFDDYY